MTGQAAASAAIAEDSGSRASAETETSWPGAARSMASWSVQRFIETTRAGAAAAGAAKRARSPQAAMSARMAQNTLRRPTKPVTPGVA